MDSTLTISIKHIQRGQPRPYAPHTYRSRIMFTSDDIYQLPDEEDVKALAQVFVHPFTEEPRDSSMASHFMPRLERCELEHDFRHPESLGYVNDEHTMIWDVEVQEPFCD